MGANGFDDESHTNALRWIEDAFHVRPDWRRRLLQTVAAQPTARLVHEDDVETVIALDAPRMQIRFTRGEIVLESPSIEAVNALANDIRKLAGEAVRYIGRSITDQESLDTVSQPVRDSRSQPTVRPAFDTPAAKAQ
jgi:hypothetical protein